MPRSWNEVFITSAAALSWSAPEGDDVQPASATSAAATGIRAYFMLVFMSVSPGQRLMAGTMDSALLALTPMYTPSAMVASLPNLGSGKRCWR